MGAVVLRHVGHLGQGRRRTLAPVLEGADGWGDDRAAYAASGADVSTGWTSSSREHPTYTSKRSRSATLNLRRVVVPQPLNASMA
jgi:hypothetical protein